MINKKDTIEIYMGDNDAFRINDICFSSPTSKMKVIRLPRRKKWQKVLNVITFGLYKVSPNYVFKMLYDR